ncbi:uncharacterized protein LOC135167613 [Diachasmimorpha longicaudata]|uniref:uncharacterized protein LOC135167613 n=1 Tax=Diachasmimorpha longicaudata TaxID=58733 RepID=UPI0030B88D2B
MMLKILTYASLMVAANAYLSHQLPRPIAHSPYYNHNALASHYGYHGGYATNNYNHILPHHHAAAHPWAVSPGVHNNNLNPHQYFNGGLIQPHLPHPTVSNYAHSTALTPTTQQVVHKNHVVPPSIQAVNQPAPVRPINYQHRPVIPPVFSHHTSMYEQNGYQNHGNWAW